MTQVKHYVVFYSPGTFVDETSRRPIESWNTAAALGLYGSIEERHGAKPYAFEFETRIESADVPDGFGGSLKVQPKTVKTSCRYFINGRVETIDQVNARNDPKESILRDNMRWNKYAAIVVTQNSWRHHAAFRGEDVIVDLQGNITERADSPKWRAYQAEKFPEQEAVSQ
jgi:hypothetical protein